MTDDDWDAGFAKSLTVFLNGDAISEPDRAGRAGPRRLLPAAVQRERARISEFTIPPQRYGEQWSEGAGHARSTLSAILKTRTPVKPGDACRDQPLRAVAAPWLSPQAGMPAGPSPAASTRSPPTGCS